MIFKITTCFISYHSKGVLWSDAANGLELFVTISVISGQKIKK